MNTLPLPADRIIPAWSPVPQFAVQYPAPTPWQAYIPMITQQCATIITANAQKNNLRCFSHNLFSQNGWQNEGFINLVIFAIDYLTYLSETNQMPGDLQSTMTQVCDQVVKCISVMNLQEYPSLWQMLDASGQQSSQASMNEFQQMRQLVQNHRNMKGMQQQPMQMPGMQMGAPGMVQGTIPGMSPGIMPGMIQGVQMGGDPRFNSGPSGMAVMPGMQRAQQPATGMRIGMPGGVMNPYGMARDDQREVAKAMITQQREALGGGGRWNKATDETIDSSQAIAQQVGMGNAFEQRFSAAASAAPARSAAPVAHHQSTPPTTDASESTMNTTFQYPEGYFRNRELDSPEDRAMNMTNYKRAIVIGALPPDALTPYDTPPKKEVVPVKAAAPVQAVEVQTKATPREPAEQEADPTASSSTEQATAARWWDAEEHQIPEAIQETGAALDQARGQGYSSERAAIPIAEDVQYVEIGTNTTGTNQQVADSDPDYTLEDEDFLHRWVPHGSQWYRQLYQPSRQQRKLKVYRDGRPSDQVVLDRAPEDIPNMDYAQHVINTPSGRRVSADADADRLLAAQKKIKEATDAYYANPAKNAEGTDSKLVLENPVTTFEAQLITEVEGAESTVWTLNNLKRAMREKESGQAIDIFVTNALLYEAVYCHQQDYPIDVKFLKGVYKLNTFTDLHAHLETHREMAEKALWELVNKRATIMLNQTLVLTMSLNEDVLISDFFSDFQSVDQGIQHTPDVVRHAWLKVQLRQLRAFFHEADEGDMQRNTDSLAYFLPDEKDAYLQATQYVASLCTLTQLSIDAADLDIALEIREVAQITESTTPTLFKIAGAVFDAMGDLGNTKHMNHLLRTQDGVVYQLTFGALVDDALLISRRQYPWVDAR